MKLYWTTSNTSIYTNDTTYYNLEPYNLEYKWVDYNDWQAFTENHGIIAIDPYDTITYENPWEKKMEKVLDCINFL